MYLCKIIEMKREEKVFRSNSYVLHFYHVILDLIKMSMQSKMNIDNQNSNELKKL